MGKQTAQNRTKSYTGSTFRGETMLRSHTCFVVLKVSDARKGAESHSEAATNDRMQGGSDGRNFPAELIRSAPFHMVI